MLQRIDPKQYQHARGIVTTVTKQYWITTFWRARNLVPLFKDHIAGPKKIVVENSAKARNASQRKDLCLVEMQSNIQAKMPLNFSGGWRVQSHPHWPKRGETALRLRRGRGVTTQTVHPSVAILRGCMLCKGTMSHREKGRIQVHEGKKRWYLFEVWSS